jgi:hypothetical protein
MDLSDKEKTEIISSSYQQMCYKESKNGKAGERTSSWVTEP